MVGERIELVAYSSPVGHCNVEMFCMERWDGDRTEREREREEEGGERV